MHGSFLGDAFHKLSCRFTRRFTPAAMQPAREISVMRTRPSSIRVCAVLAFVGVISITPNVSAQLRMFTSSRESTETARNVARAVQQARRDVNAGIVSSGGRQQDQSQGDFPESPATYTALHAWEFEVDEESGGGVAWYASSAAFLNVPSIGHSLEMSLLYDFYFEVYDEAIVSFVPLAIAPSNFAFLSLWDVSGSLLTEDTLDISSFGTQAELHIPQAGTYTMRVAFGPHLSGELPLVDSQFFGPEVGLAWTMTSVPAPLPSALFAICGCMGLRRKRA